ncbi:MlaD family protein [Gordonia sp. (in: high G+C Gram-positive bacteria)]|uniref:MlaD family protein n=1 Tax=Gordonia sp. (in: high G+C Gram-positive bacteria) TaxID=84139 RepID=UPI001D71F496|nr:MlaD family protein [Gordonia sp. (in: high G+C Gram-positive bacteria)]MCB1296372.1 hypothetical protein [Gordonia sp. (in: high G+C Gram-positive bacteria)]HMS77396.1 hypothetical protein [Gordonia sp. (in: high G+C Gram-positive bacteria)]HQV17928.1 hypothetical protein [Gordonia sp. (in: high G+C Gram-positive bacteria)]
MVSGFLVGSEHSRRATMRRTGLIGVVVAVLVGLLFAVVIPALTPRDKDLMTVYVNTSAVGSGVGHGTDVMLRGAAVGKVSDLKVNEDGSARITMELRKHLVDGMGKDFGLDFRPKNYFGITGITITDPGTREAGLLADGTRVERRDAADYSMATMLERGSDVANGVLVDDTVKVIQRMLAYSKAFEPLMHTGVVFADVVARTQRQMPAYLLDRYNDIVTALPPFADGALSGLTAFYDSDIRLSGDTVQNNFTDTLQAISDNFFSMVGRLLKSNQANLLPWVNIIKEVGTVLPAIGEGTVTTTTVRDLVTRLNGAFEPRSDGGRNLKINLAIEKLPVFDGPVVGLPLKAGPR